MHALNLYSNTVLDGSVILSVSVILFVRYRNLFPVVRFQNQAHIRNPHGTGQVYKTIWGAAGTPIFYCFIAAKGSVSRRPEWGAPGAPNFLFYLLPPPKLAVSKWAPLPRRAREIPPKAGVSRVYDILRNYLL